MSRDSEFSLFGEDAPSRSPTGPARPRPAGGTGSDDDAAPLAARMRPRTLDEFLGQEGLVGTGRALRALLDRGEVTSFILWGPPGSGKTTLARLVAERVDATFVSVSAVTAGVARIREIAAEARERRRVSGRRTLLFCDEIHRFNKAQQDAFLPHVEDGTLALIGATTENPSFEIVRPLLSRAPVFVLEPLSPEDLETILSRAVSDPRGLGARTLQVEDGVLHGIADAADGDARRALGILESAAALADAGVLTRQVASEAVQHRFAVYDKGGEERYTVVSALHKSVRGSDPDGALYWLARMLEGGEEPLYVARRLVRMAVEDVGLADPQALALTVAAQECYRFLGSPEGELGLAHATVYLALAPKSNRVYRAMSEARDAARRTRSAPVPLHLRNPATSLLGDLGYGEGYRYDPDEPEGVARQEYLPPALADARFYRPTSGGFEKELGRRLAWFRERRGLTEDPGGQHSDATD